MNSDSIMDEIRPLVREHFKELETEDFVPGESRVRLSRPTFGASEVLEAIDSMLSTYVTMGEKVKRFEHNWGDYVGTEFAHMVNSGSSANLLALRALEGDVINPGDEVIVPAVAWSTTLFPVLDIDATPVLVDVDPDTYTIDVDSFEAAVSDETAAVVLVHLLGNPCNMEPIQNICQEHNVTIIEDSCEAHGATYDGQPVGSFGDIGTFSFFFSHHISTMEGGMVVTDSINRSERIRMARAHGWVRELDDINKLREENPDIDPKFLFAAHGYNLRPTELQGAFGIHQLPKLDDFVEIRRENANQLTDLLEPVSEYFDLFEESDRARASWFAYPLLVNDRAPFTRDALQEYLEDHHIETRPILAGNLERQPVMKTVDYRVSGSLTGAQRIHTDGLFIGNHHRLTTEKLDYVADVIRSFVAEHE